MANVKEILAVVRGALKDEPGTITVSAAKDGVDVLAWMEGVSGGDWEIHVAIPFGDDLTGPLSAAYGRADASGYYHPVPAPEVPGPVTARGGALPLRWLVNGRPIGSAPFRRQAEWQPDGRGAARVTVIDGLGRSASAGVWLK